VASANAIISFVPDAIRWGILSTGWIAEQFVNDLRLVPDGEPVAVGSRTPAAARAFADRFGIPRAHGSWQALVDDPEVDAIYVATPHHAHFDASMLSLSAGKATLTEKPITLDAASAEKLVETARVSGIFLMEAMWMRCIPAIRRAAGLIADGTIGDVTTVQADFGLEGPFSEPHRLVTKALGGGALLDLGIYPVTFAHLFLGVPRTIEAWASLTDGGVDDNTGMLFGYDSGALALLACSLNGDTPRTATITGTLGRIEFGRGFFNPRGFTLWHDETAEQVALPFEGTGYHFEAAEVQRCLREGLVESPLIPHAETLSVMRTLDAIRAKIGVIY
jgi:predicted dehydrogenase